MIESMCGLASKRAGPVGLSPAVLLGLLLGAFVLLQCFLPLGTAVKIGADEDFELSKATLCLKGYRLFTQIWCDQPHHCHESAGLRAGQGGLACDAPSQQL